MRRLSITAVLSLAVLAGCVQAVSTYNIDDYKTVPKVVYTAHLYSSGIGERLRAVFLKSPGNRRGNCPLFTADNNCQGYI